MKKYIAIVFITLLVTGCATTPTGQIEAFGAAAANVTSKIDTVISDYNEANINNKLTKMAQRSKKYSKPDFDPIKKILIRESNKNDFALYKANKALGAYAVSLSDLAKAGSQEEIALAGVKLSTSLKSMNNHYNMIKGATTDLLSDEKSGKISRVIAEITSLYSENKRASALKDIIISADDQIQIIGKLIKEQLLKGVLESRIYTMRGTVLAGYFADYNSSTKNKTFAARKKSLDFIYKKYLEMESTSSTVAQATKAITSVMKAHAKLKSELQKDRFNSKEIVNAISDIKSVHNSYDDLEALISSCKGEIVADESKGIICKV